MSLIREPNAEPLPGYRLIEPLGTGGFGEVWKCEVPGGLFKAIKFVYGNLESKDGDSARAEQEQAALQRIREVRHPFVLSMEQIRVIEGELIIVMELGDKTLHDRMLECQGAGLVGIPRPELLGYIRDAAEALDHMNQKHNLQHLDIKPRNLFLISDRVKVADFGLVKHLERQSGMLGSVTPLYAPPETFVGNISESSDQYSLAIVYMELLTGQRPFNGKNARQLALQHTQSEPELRALVEQERPVVARALAKDPTKRYPDCLAFVRALYTARTPPRAEPIVLEALSGPGKRPKTMVDTLETFQLEQAEEDMAAALSPPPQERAPSEADVSELGLTVQQPQSGALRPTIIIGLGAFGRRAIFELRCRFLDRFGDVTKIPLLEFLYIDPDKEAIKASVRGSPEMACTANEVYHLPLQPVGNYRRRMLDQLNEWLPREKLYSLPRSLQTQGSRALGRLAFADNHLRLLARLKRQLQKVTHPDSLYQSVSQTGLALRDGKPRVYVIAAAGGGSSGFLVDLGFGLRRLLQQMRYRDADVHCLLFCGAPEDPATPKPEQANIYATLTELNHFSDPSIPFSAQYGPDSARLNENGQPFTNVYLLRLNHRSPETLRDAIARLGSYLFHELTTPLGLRLDRNRNLTGGTGPTNFRSFGTYGVWFPRGLLLRLAARQACIRLLTEWQASGEPTALAEVEAACDRALADPDLRFEALCARIEEVAGTGEVSLAQGLATLLTSLDQQSEQALAYDDPGRWARDALAAVHDWVGTSSNAAQDSGWRRSRLSRTLNTAIKTVAEEWDQRLAKAAFSLMEHPGRRVAAAESAFDRIREFFQKVGGVLRTRLEEQIQQTSHAEQKLEAALENCVAGGGAFNFFGGRTRRVLRVFMDHLAAYSRQRLTEELTAAGLQFFSILNGRLEERARDLGFCRQRLRSLQERLEASSGDTDDLGGSPVSLEITPMRTPIASAESYWDVIRETETARLVLPYGETDLDRAATQFLCAEMNPEKWTQLDQALQDQVLGTLGGLHHICATSSDLGKYLANPLLSQAANCLGDHLPITDVAQVELGSTDSGKVDLTSQLQKYLASAAPLVASKDGSDEQAFLLVPASDAGKIFGEQALRVKSELELVPVPGQADLMFCREQSSLSLEDLQRVFHGCRTAFTEAAFVPNTSPHARFDIVDWIPLDP